MDDLNVSSLDDISKMNNIDHKTVKSFGDEWSKYDQEKLKGEEHKYLFDAYFHIFPWETLPDNAQGFDMGCGSGRWALLVAPKVKKLTCIDPSIDAINVAKLRLSNLNNISFINSGVSDNPLSSNSQDFGYSIGVLHHVPDTLLALCDCIRILKPGAPFLVYLYYRFDNRPMWYVLIWKISDIFRKGISNMPSTIKLIITNLIALIVYLPLSRLALFFEKLGLNVNNWLLSSYRNTSFYTMRTDSRDRFGTPLEKRFTRSEIETMLNTAGLENIHFSNKFPFWCAVGTKKLFKS